MDFDLKEESEECLTERRRVADHRSDEVKRLSPCGAWFKLIWERK